MLDTLRVHASTSCHLNALCARAKCRRLARQTFRGLAFVVHASPKTRFTLKVAAAVAARQSQRLALPTIAWRDTVGHASRMTALMFDTDDAYAAKPGQQSAKSVLGVQSIVHNAGQPEASMCRIVKPIQRRPMNKVNNGN